MEIQLHLFVHAETVSISLNEDSGHSGEPDTELDHASQHLKSLPDIIGVTLCVYVETAVSRVISHVDVAYELKPSSWYTNMVILVINASTSL